MMRTCVHCVIARVVRLEAVAGGSDIRVGHGPPVTLPHAGGAIFRALRALVREARAAGDGPIKLRILDMPGWSRVEITATVRVGRGARVLGRAFDRHVAGTLEGGFLEGLA
ncbi:MAG: hypothetical protein KIT14_17110 [bacterium]|nr:hypothetical protein [bacterium]